MSEIIDYDNMLMLHYLSGKKLVVIINPAKKKSIALFFQKDISIVKAEETARHIFESTEN